MIIDPKSNVPIFRQIADQIREAVNVGVYQPAEALPSLRALAVEIRVNPNTVQRAYDELEREGVIESRRGLGVFVVDQRRLTAGSRAEKKLASQFQNAVSTALAEGVTPARMRELFECTLRANLQTAGKQR
ncbi:MAG: GntR family transcriptional regulator [Planctomycetota bacterium]|nr:GntR family transcriptional regulator [Planctomycetota bacterium]